jgi:hypothetical protein
LRITVWGVVTGAFSNPRGMKRRRGLEEGPWVADWAEEHGGEGVHELSVHAGLVKRQFLNGTSLASSVQVPATFGNEFKASYRFPND